MKAALAALALLALVVVVLSYQSFAQSSNVIITANVVVNPTTSTSTSTTSTSTTSLPTTTIRGSGISGNAFTTTTIKQKTIAQNGNFAFVLIATISIILLLAVMTAVSKYRNKIPKIKLKSFTDIRPPKRSSSGGGILAGLRMMRGRNGRPRKPLLPRIRRKGE